MVLSSSAVVHHSPVKRPATIAVVDASPNFQITPRPRQFSFFAAKYPGNNKCALCAVNFTPVYYFLSRKYGHAERPASVSQRKGTRRGPAGRAKPSGSSRLSPFRAQTFRAIGGTRAR
jgi:hypothetical protein